MHRSATSLAAALALVAASAAQSMDRKPAPDFEPAPGLMTPYHVHAFIGCDDGVAVSAYFQDTDRRVGNVFDFGTGAILSQVEFAHYGFEFPGPYNYNLELWDPESCTLISARNGLVAADAANRLQVESVDLCGEDMHGVGNLLVAIDPNTCADHTDCYPDLLFDNQFNVSCPMEVFNAGDIPDCFDVSPFSGPFLLRVQLDNCITRAKAATWGQLKRRYH